MVLVLVLVAAVAAGLARTSSRFPPTVRVRLELAALTPLPLASRQHATVAVTRPSCDAYPPCVAAAVTWIATAPDTITSLESAIPSWASRNGLTSQGGWHCGAGFGLFGERPAFGCQLSLWQKGRDDAVYVAVTFADRPGALAGAHEIANPLTTLGQLPLATVAVQVVRDSH
jgi:hypothetical protein